jgi:iron-sulfur cluster assembly accessory protein
MILRGVRVTLPVRTTGSAERKENPTVITLTDTAASKVKELLEAEGATDLALRVAVRPGGCSGFSYEMFFDGDFAADDEKALFGPDEAKVAVVVDQASKQLLEGATLDYKDGLNQAGFSITNPNATRTCGCGSSFS